MQNGGGLGPEVWSGVLPDDGVTGVGKTRRFVVTRLVTKVGRAAVAPRLSLVVAMEPQSLATVTVNVEI